MSRPKGSKNKVKKVITDAPAVNGDALEMEAEQIIEETLKASDTVNSTGCKNCGHEFGLHYGTKEQPNLTWCNRGGCECQALLK